MAEIFYNHRKLAKLYVKQLSGIIMNEILLMNNKKPIIASETELLLNMQGVSGSKIIKDLSPNEKKVTTVGQTELSSSLKLYGNTSCQISYSGDGVVIEEAFPGGFKSEPWTFEAFIRSCSPQIYAAIVTIGAKDSSGSGGIIVSTEGTFVGVAGGWLQGGPISKFNWPVCDWRHFACTYDLSTLSIFFNGSRQAVISIPANQIVMSHPKYLMLGKNWTNSNRFQGYFQDTSLSSKEALA